MDIVILDGYTLFPEYEYWKDFEKFGNVTYYDRTSYDETIKRIGKAEIVITNKTVIDKNIIENTNIKYIGVLATGYNIIDIDLCKKMGITVCNIPSYSTMAVAQLTFAMLLEITNRVYVHNKSVKKGDWANCTDFSYTVSPLNELLGKTMGLIGYGSIGKAVSKIAQSFGMNVIYYKPSGKCEDDSSICKYDSFENVLLKSDVISLHCPLNDSTKEIINKDTISLMKKGAIVINTARGGAINEKDVCDALDSGKISYYLADVVSSEPPRKDSLIINNKNSIITPHIAWQAIETKKRLLSIAISNLDGFISGKAINKVC